MYYHICYTHTTYTCHVIKEIIPKNPGFYQYEQKFHNDGKHFIPSSILFLQ